MILSRYRYRPVTIFRSSWPMVTLRPSSWHYSPWPSLTVYGPSPSFTVPHRPSPSLTVRRPWPSLTVSDRSWPLSWFKTIYWPFIIVNHRLKEVLTVYKRSGTVRNGEGQWGTVDGEGRSGTVDGEGRSGTVDGEGRSGTIVSRWWTMGNACKKW
jgi:hypothetical protein